MQYSTVTSKEVCNKEPEAYATCPAGTKLISGGYILTQFEGEAPHNSPDRSYPNANANAWVISGAGGNERMCWKGVAMCGK